MSPNSHPSWHTTEDDAAIPVRIVTEEHVQPSSAHPLHAETLPTMRKPSLFLPATLGIGIVFVGLGWYFDLGSLVGDVGDTPEKTVTITAEGTFDPTELTVSPGESVTIRNEHENPQVLKPESTRELSLVPIVFDEPFIFVVPADAIGPYTYSSETLPADKTVTFNVRLPEVASATESASSAAVISDGLPIPIPFGMNEISEPTSTPQANVTTTHESDPTIISLGGGKKEPESETKRTEAKIPTNPYTVAATGADQIRAGAEAIAQEEQLHSGAALAKYKNYRPPVTSSTGPEHTAVIVLLLSGLLFAPLARRMLRI